MTDISKFLYDMADNLTSDYQYLGIYMFVTYKNNIKYNFLSDDVVKFIERAFESNSISFENLLTKYEIFKEFVDLDD